MEDAFLSTPAPAQSSTRNNPTGGYNNEDRKQVAEESVNNSIEEVTSEAVSSKYQCRYENVSVELRGALIITWNNMHSRRN